jgi:hypothetical protein
VSAQAGFGKTTLAAQWLEHIPVRSAWLSVDGNEGDLERFLRYVVAALRTAVPGLCEGVQTLLTATHLPSPEHLAEAMVSDLEALGERMVTIDCDVIQADGGTRTAAISGGYVALALAMQRLSSGKSVKKNPLHGRVAAVSVGIYRGTPVLDLDYDEDSEAETDMNIVMNEAGRYIEIQGTAEGHAFSEEEFAAMIGLAKAGIEHIIEAQDAALARVAG